MTDMQQFFEFKDDQSQNQSFDETKMKVEGEKEMKEDLEQKGELIQPIPPKDNKEKEKNANVFVSFLKKVLIITLTLLSNLLLLYPFLALGGSISVIVQIVMTISSCFKQFKYIDVINAVFMCIFSLTILMVTKTAVSTIFKEELTMYDIWFIDAFFLFITHIMVFTIIKLIKQGSDEMTVALVCPIQDHMNRDALIANWVGSSEHPNKIDIPLVKAQWEQEYLRILQTELDVDYHQQRFNTLLSTIQNPDIYQYMGYQFFFNQNRPLQASAIQFLVLQIISLIKVLFCLLYLYVNSQINFIYVTVIALFNFNEIFCFNSMLSNYDLRRKTMLLSQINDVINVSGQDIDHFKCIDVISNMSIETWDNSRRAVLGFFSKIQMRLERTYICIFIYYVFIVNIIFACYGGIYIIIHKDSILMHPLVVISATFTFLTLNVILFFRIYHGQQFNDTLQDVSTSIDSIVGIMQDLLQQYDFYFTERNNDAQLYSDLVKLKKSTNQLRFIQSAIKKGDELNESRKQDMKESYIYEPFQYEDKSLTCYDVIVSKVKRNAEIFISTKKEFLGKVYKKGDENKLHQKIVKNALQSFYRIKEQVAFDAQEKSYKVFNLVQLDFKDTLVTISFGLLTILPSLITQFIGFFNTDKSPVEGQ